MTSITHYFVFYISLVFHVWVQVFAGTYIVT